jgi:S-DNA-T family DNA segregation ATPase FtsK/SpoIIIE
MARAQVNQTFQEVLSLVLLGAGTLYFLALISYSPGDVPSWFPLSSHAGARGPVLNFIGRTGAIVACCSYAFLGAASYLLTALLFGYGGAKLLDPETRIGWRGLWAIGFVFSGAAIVHLLPWPVLNLDRLNIAGQGGWVGKWIGEFIFRNTIGTFVSVLALLVIYTVSLFYLTRINPLEVARQLMAIPPALRARYFAWRMSRADEKGRLQIEAERVDKARRKLEKSLSRKGVAPPAESPVEKPAPIAPPPALALAAEDEPARPAPQIIDSSLPPPPRKKDPKKDKFPPLSSFSCENYELPSLSLLDPFDAENRETANPGELLAIQDQIIETLAEFDIAVSRGDITRGPTITRYEVFPAKGVRVDKITNLERDLARATRAERINILAPIPGKDTVGIEIANSKKQKVTLRELLESDDFQNAKAKIPIALGKDVYGKTIIGDLAAMPHGLVAGTTGSGKSVCINAIIASILYRFSPEDLRFIMIDPKVVEMQIYNTLPHLVVPVVTDPKKVLLALRWAIDEMEKRYAIFAKTGVRNIGSFNARPKPKTQAELDAEAAAKAAEMPELPLDAAPVDPESLTSEERIENMTTVKNIRDTDLIIPDRMPYIVIIVDELADLMQTAPADVESAIARITQKARAAGIHMIIATQTPRADVITGVIKANVPCRIAFQVASALDSRVILDENGAERLLGQGDMMYRPPGTSRMLRAQGVLVTDEEIHRVVEHASAQSEPAFENSIHERMQGSGEGDEEAVSDEDEELVEKCIEVMRQEKKASTSLFQRRLRLGYTRAARILDILEDRGYVGPGEGAKPREILVDLDAIA